MKKIIIFIIALTIMFTLSACSDDDDIVTMRILSGQYTNLTEKDYIINNIIQDFEDENNVRIYFETLSEDDIYTKLEAESQSGVYDTDIIISHSGKMFNFINAGFMQDVTALEDDMDDRSFLSAFDSATQVDGVRYFFPTSADVYISIASKDAFDSLPAGLTQADIKAGDYTWDDYVAWAQELGENSVCLKALPTNQLIYQIGGMTLSNGGAFPGMNDAGNIKTWENIYDMLDNIHPDSLTNNACTDMLSDGRVDLAFDHIAPVGNAYKLQPANYVVFPGPKGISGLAGSIAGSFGIGIVDGSENTELAEKFIEEFTSVESIYDAAVGAGGFIPAVEEAIDMLTNDAEDTVIRQGLSTLVNASVSGLDMIPEYTAGWGLVKNVYDAVYTAMRTNSSVTLRINDIDFTIPAIGSKADIPAALVEAQKALDETKN